LFFFKDAFPSGDMATAFKELIQ
jgi:hypothetical protein